MKILVIGSEGNIGSRLVPHLKKEHDVFCVDQVQGFDSDYAVCNIMNVGDIYTAFDHFEPDIVFHLAAMVSRVTCEASPYLAVDTNLTGLNNVIQACKIFGAKLIYFSTSEVYGNIGGMLSEDRECKPNNLYGLTKYLGEKLIEYNLKDGLRALTVRPFMFYDEKETRGDHRSAMIRFCYNLINGRKIKVHNGSCRSWLHISDGVKILSDLMMINNYDVVNVGSDELILTIDLVKMICDEIGISMTSDLIEVTELPEKMTLEKIPDIRKMMSYSNHIQGVTMKEGVRRVVNELRNNTA